jgi:hypothetical protein
MLKCTSTLRNPTNLSAFVGNSSTNECLSVGFNRKELISILQLRNRAASLLLTHWTNPV